MLRTLLLLLISFFYVSMNAYFIKDEYFIDPITNLEINLFYETHKPNNRINSQHCKQLKYELIGIPRKKPLSFLVERPLKIDGNIYAKGPARLFYKENVLAKTKADDVEVRGVALSILYMLQFDWTESDSLVNCELTIGMAQYKIYNLTFNDCVMEYENNLKNIESWAQEHSKNDLFKYEIQELEDNFVLFIKFLQTYEISLENKLFDYIRFIKKKNLVELISQFSFLIDGISCNFIQLNTYIKLKEIDSTNNVAIVLGANHSLHLSALLKRDGYKIKKEVGTYDCRLDPLTLSEVKLITQSNGFCCHNYCLII